MRTVLKPIPLKEKNEESRKLENNQLLMKNYKHLKSMTRIKIITKTRTQVKQNNWETSGWSH